MCPFHRTWNLLRYVLLALLILAALNPPSYAASQTTTTYQGRLTDAAGMPLDGDYQVTFALYVDSLSVSPSWQETHEVTCIDGLFTVDLGKTSAFPYWVIGESGVFLGITVGTDPELFPRRRLTSALSAMRVGSIDRAAGGTILGNVYVTNWVNGQTAVQAYGGLQGGHFQAADPTTDAVGLRGFYGGIGPHDAKGVSGEAVASDGYGIGGEFTGGWYGVYARGVVPSYSEWSHTGVRGTAEGYAGSGSNFGVSGTAGGGLFSYGVKGYGYHNGTPGANTYGVYGSAGYFDGFGAWAGYFNGWTTCNGTLEVMGTLIKPAGSFRIDHPLDPENKFLQHSLVESPDMKNIYDGNVVTDANGDATVTMPDWFSALNRDFCYQLTVIGQFAQAIVSEKLNGNRFSIKTDKPNVEVSWQLTGIRKDAYANAHRIEVEVDKKPQEVGLYIDPVAFGKAPEKQLHYKMNKAAEDDRKAEDERSKANAKKRSTQSELPAPTQEK